MVTWRQQFAQIIGEMHEDMPKDATLQDRIKFLRDHKPHHVIGGTSWGEKAWQAARRDYLKRYGYVSPHRPKPLESPLERMMRRAGD